MHPCGLYCVDLLDFTHLDNLTRSQIVDFILLFRRVPVMKEPLLYCPLLKEGAPLIPSTVSAFCPLSKTYHHVTASELPLNRSSSYGDLPSGKTPSYTDHQGNRSPTYSPSNNNYTAALSGHGNGSPSNNNNNNNALHSSELELQ